MGVRGALPPGAKNGRAFWPDRTGYGRWRFSRVVGGVGGRAPHGAPRSRREPRRLRTASTPQSGDGAGRPAGETKVEPAAPGRRPQAAVGRRRGAAQVSRPAASGGRHRRHPPPWGRGEKHPGAGRHKPAPLGGGEPRRGGGPGAGVTRRRGGASGGGPGGGLRRLRRRDPPRLGGVGGSNPPQDSSVVVRDGALRCTHRWTWVGVRRASRGTPRGRATGSVL